MEALEAEMKKHNIHLEHSSNSSSGMALSTCGFQASQSGYALNVSSSSHSHEWLIGSTASYHMAKNKAMFSSLNDYDESEDENPPPPSQDPPSTPSLPKWVQATRNAAGDLAGDPTDGRRTRSQFERASPLLAQVSTNYDPDTFAEASGHPHWDTVMSEEYHSLLANDTWDLVPLPKGRKLVRCKWVYRTKYGPDGKIDKHKARPVAKGLSQVEGIDYTETFSPVAKMNFLHLVLSLPASFKWEFHQMDVKSAFLHGDLHEEIYME
eukprot:PITA_21606